MNEDKDTMLKYAKTHGHTEPGEQKNREYNWPVDKSKFIFFYFVEEILNST